MLGLVLQKAYKSQMAEKAKEGTLRAVNGTADSGAAQAKKRRRWDQTTDDTPQQKKKATWDESDAAATPSSSRWDATPGRKGAETPGHVATPSASTRHWAETPGHATPGAATPGRDTPGHMTPGHQATPSARKNRWDETPKTERGTQHFVCQDKIETFVASNPLGYIWEKLLSAFVKLNSMVEFSLKSVTFVASTITFWTHRTDSFCPVLSLQRRLVTAVDGRRLRGRTAGRTWSRRRRRPRPVSASRAGTRRRERQPRAACRPPAPPLRAVSVAINGAFRGNCLSLEELWLGRFEDDGWFSVCEKWKKKLEGQVAEYFCGTNLVQSPVICIGRNC